MSKYRMENPPKTKEATKNLYYKDEYGWDVYNPFRCAYAVNYRTKAHYQCLRKPGYGPVELYCKQHAKIVERKREE